MPFAVFEQAFRIADIPSPLKCGLETSVQSAFGVP